LERTRQSIVWELCAAGSGRIPRQNPGAAARQQHPFDINSESE